MEVLKVFCFLFLSLTVKFGKGNQDNSEKCLTDSCLQSSVQDVLPTFMRGLPDIGIPSLDPLVVEKLELKLPGGLNIAFKHGIARGFKDCKVKSAKLRHDQFEVRIECNLIITAKYKSSGRLLVFPVNGDGDSVIKCNKLHITGLFKIGSRMEANGQRHLFVESFNSTHNFGGRVSYAMTNIFKGNPVISKSILEFMNSNWRLVAEEFGKPLVEVGIKAIKKNLDIMLHILPIHAFIGSADIFGDQNMRDDPHKAELDRLIAQHTL